MELKQIFPELITSMNDECRRAWERTRPEIPEWLMTCPFEQQMKNERRLERRLSVGRRQLNAKRIPHDTAGRLQFLNRLESSFHRYWMPVKELSLDHQQAFHHLSFDFVRQSLEFDPDLDWDQIKQAIRNIWIMGTIQFYLGMSIRLKFPMLAYSLLYPYTDNYLDDDTRSSEDKRRFCRMIELSIQGDRSMRGESRLESGIATLLDRINDSYPPSDLPMVRMGLSAILKGQRLSLEQQKEKSLSESDLLDITLLKGGSSVLADALLVDPGLGKDNLFFFYGMGVFLQLIDDFQDLAKDEQHNQQTIFSRHGMTGRPDDWDGLICRILHLIDTLTETAVNDQDVYRRDSARMIRKQSIQLVLQTIAIHADRLSSSFVTRMESYSELRFDTIRRIKLENVGRYHQKNDEILKKLNS